MDVLWNISARAFSDSKLLGQFYVKTMKVSVISKLIVSLSLSF